MSFSKSLNMMSIQTKLMEFRMEQISRSNFKMLEVPITRFFFILSLLMHTASVSAKTDNLRNIESLSMSDGWAVDRDESNAVKRAADMLETATPNHAYSIKNPKFLVAYFTQEFSGEKLASAIEKRYPGVPVFGFSVLKAVFTTDGMHMGEEGVEGALALMGFDSAGLKVGVAIQDVKTRPSKSSLLAAPGFARIW